MSTTSKVHGLRSKRNIEITSHMNKKSLTDQEIVEETYSSPNASDTGSQKQLHANKKSKISTTTIPSTDSTSQVSLPMETTPILPIHSLSSTEEDISSHDHSPEKRDAPIDSIVDDMILDDHQTKPDTDQPKPNMVITNVSDIFSQPQVQDEPMAELFIPRDSFDKELSNNTIIERIKKFYINNNDVIKIRLQKKMNFTYFVITLRSRDMIKKYVNKPVPALSNARPYELTQDNVHNLLNVKLKSQDDNIIKVIDVPYHYNPDLIIEAIQHVTGKVVINFQELKKRPQIIRTKNTRKGPIKIFPAYKQIIVSFADKSTVDYVLQRESWGIEVENFFVRFIPGNPEHPMHKQRTSHSYMVTGLPLNTTYNDLLPLINHIHGKSCTFTQTNRNSLHKCARIGYNPEARNVQHLSAPISTSLHKFNIYVYPSFTATCGNCGHHNHQIIDCPDKNYNINETTKHKQYIKRFIQRNTAKIVVDDKLKSSYGHVLKLSHNSRPSPKDANRPVNKSFQQYQPDGHFNSKITRPQTKDRQHPQPTTPQLDDATIKRLQNLENAVKDLTEEVHVLKEFKKKAEINLANINENQKIFKEGLLTMKETQDGHTNCFLSQDGKLNQLLTLMEQRNTLTEQRSSSSRSSNSSRSRSPKYRAAKKSTTYSSSYRDVKQQFTPQEITNIPNIFDANSSDAPSENYDENAASEYEDTETITPSQQATPISTSSKGFLQGLNPFSQKY